MVKSEPRGIDSDALKRLLKILRLGIWKLECSTLGSLIGLRFVYQINVSLTDSKSHHLNRMILPVNGKGSALTGIGAGTDLVLLCVLQQEQYEQITALLIRFLHICC